MLRKVFCLFFGFVVVWPAIAQSERVEKMMKELAVEEKIDLLCADAPSVERLNIVKYDWWSECLHGVARNGKATVYPKPIGLGCIWDESLVQRIASAISDEARAKYHAALRKQGYTKRYEGLTFFSPTLNIARDPRWGRTSECFSEDPLLTGTIGSAFIKGLQGDDPKYLKLVATSKHFVANNEENRRHDGSADVDAVSLREYYLPAFEQSIREGDVTSVMSAYNALNGVPCTANTFLLTDLLRDEWGFNGVVISDGSAVEKIFTHHHYASTSPQGAAMALLAGCDMSLRDEFRKGLRQAYSLKMVTENDIDRALVRVLTLRERLGMFDTDADVPYSQIPETVIECENHRHLALEAARRSIVLLENKDKLLPLNKAKTCKIGLIGEAFTSNYYGDYSGIPEFQSTLQEEIQKRSGNCQIRWISDISEAVIVPSTGFQRDEKYAYEGKVGLTGEYYATSDLTGSPFLVRNDHTIHHVLNKDADIASKSQVVRSIRWSSNLVGDRDGKHVFTFEGKGHLNVIANGKKVPLMDGRNLFALDLQKGVAVSILLEFTEIQSGEPVSLLWKQPSEGAALTLEQFAQSSDVAILFIRDDGGAEGKDRATLSLSEKQLNLIKKVTAANPRTILILGSSSPLTLTDVAPRVKALINSWIAGQGEAVALAEILFGETNPSGKTSVSFVADESQLPPLDSYDVRLGRSYQYFKGDVLYPFGYGLSYTVFKYEVPSVMRSEISDRDSIDISVKINNTGDRDGEEVVQCYASNAQWQMDGLQKKLVGFKRVIIPKGKSTIVKFTIPAKQLARWSECMNRWVVHPGRYTFSVSENSKKNNNVDCVIK